MINSESSQTVLTPLFDGSFVVVAVDGISNTLVGKRFSPLGDLLDEPFYFEHP